MNQTSFSFTYKGRKTAWYVFKQMCVLLWRGEAWFTVNFSTEREAVMMNAGEAAAYIHATGGTGSITIINNNVSGVSHV